MDVITINKYYTDGSGKILFVDASITITINSVTKSANSIFPIKMNEYNEDVAKKRVLSCLRIYKNLQQEVYNMFQLDNLTETVV
jgi:hypothetical protein